MYRQSLTHEADPICVRIILYILPQISPRHPFGHKLEGLECDPHEGHNMGVVQMFPHHGLPAKQLQNPSINEGATED